MGGVESLYSDSAHNHTTVRLSTLQCIVLQAVSNIAMRKAVLTSLLLFCAFESLNFASALSLGGGDTEDPEETSLAPG